MHHRKFVIKSNLISNIHEIFERVLQITLLANETTINNIISIGEKKLCEIP